MLTAEEFFRVYSDNTSLSEGHYDYLVDEDSFKEAIIKFAGLHVKAALKSIIENIEIDMVDTTDHSNLLPIVNKDSILNAYPLENIK